MHHESNDHLIKIDFKIRILSYSFKVVQVECLSEGLKVLNVLATGQRKKLRGRAGRNSRRPRILHNVQTFSLYLLP